MSADASTMRDDVEVILSRRKFVSTTALWTLLSSCEGKALMLENGVALRAEDASDPNDTCDGDMINRAVARVHAQGGGTVLLTSRTYTLLKPILVKSGVTLRGSGAKKTILKQGGTPMSWSGMPGSAIVTSDNQAILNNVHVVDLSIYGLHKEPIPSGGDLYAKSGIAIFNARNSTIERCVVADVGTGIGFFGSAGSSPHNNLIADCLVVNASSWVEPGNPGTPRGITMATDCSTVRNCSVEDSHTGYYVATENGVYENCSARGWRDDGFYVNANGCRLTYCSAIAADDRSKGLGSGFAVNPSSRNIFTKCIALRCPNAGMRFRHAGELAPTSNQVISCSFIDCGYGFLDDMIGASHFPAAVSRGNEFVDNLAKDCQFCGFLFIRQSEGVIRKNRAISNNRGGVTVQNIGGISFAEYCMNNKIEGNICDDPERVKTQRWGLYIYDKSITGASMQNRGNVIQHRSAYGIDVF